jgi:hypothetical protein
VSLIELQRQFFEAVTVVHPGTAPVWPNDVRGGLAIYRHAYRARLIDCLRNGFEKTCLWIGEEAFDAAANKHIDRCPPSSWTLDEAGRGFTDTLAAFFPADPEVAELGWVEWETQRAFTCVEEATLDPAAFARDTSKFGEKDWMRLRLTFSSSLNVRTVGTACAAIWTAIDEGAEMPGDIVLPAPAMLAVWRKALRSTFAMLDADEAAALELMRTGGSFNELCEVMIERRGADDGVAAAGSCLAGWIGQSMIIEMRC